MRTGAALYVPGNHCRKLYRYLNGADVALEHGLEVTVRELEALPPRQRHAASDAFRRLYEGTTPYIVLDEGRLVVVHAAIREDMIGRLSKRIEVIVCTARRRVSGRPKGSQFGETGREIQWGSVGRLRSHPDAGSSAPLQHDQYRPRVCVRRQVDGTSLPGVGGRASVGSCGVRPVVFGICRRKTELVALFDGCSRLERAGDSASRCWTDVAELTNRQRFRSLVVFVPGPFVQVAPLRHCFWLLGLAPARTKRSTAVPLMATTT